MCVLSVTRVFRSVSDFVYLCLGNIHQGHVQQLQRRLFARKTAEGLMTLRKVICNDSTHVGGGRSPRRLCTLNEHDIPRLNAPAKSELFAVPRPIEAEQAIPVQVR